jgi:hypothetical protein
VTPELEQISTNIASLDQKVTSVLDYLQGREPKENKNDLYSFFDNKEDEERAERNRYVRFERKKRIYQSIPINVDGISTDGKRELEKILKGLMPKEEKIKLPVPKPPFPALLAGLAALGIVLWALHKLLNAKLSDLLRQLTGIANLLPKNWKDIFPIPETPKIPTPGTKIAPKGTRASAEAKALEEAAIAAKKAKIAVLRDPSFIKGTPEYQKFIKGAYLSDAERLAVQKQIKTLPKFIIDGSVKDAENFLKYISGVDRMAGINPETDKLVIKTREMIRLKLLGLSPDELRNINNELKPVIMKSRLGIIEDMIYAVKEIPGTLRGMASEVIKSPFTQEEWSKTFGVIEDIFKDLGNSVGEKLTAAKTSIMESKPVQATLQAAEGLSNKVKAAVARLGPILRVLEKPLAAYIIWEDYSENIKNKGENLNAQLEGLQAGMIRWLTFGAADLKDVNDKTEKINKAWQESKHTEAYIRGVTQLVDFGLSMPNVALQKFYELIGKKDYAEYYKNIAKDIDVMDWYNYAAAKTYEALYNIVDWITLGYGVKKPKPAEPVKQDFVYRPGQRPVSFSPNDTIIGVKDLRVLTRSSEQTVEKNMKIFVDVIEKSNKSVVLELKEERLLTQRLTENIKQLSDTIIAQSKNNVNMVNNSRNLTNISMNPTTAKSYRDSVIYS